MIAASTFFGLKGAIAVSVIERGRVVREYPPIRNLILNQGLDKVASNQFANCFRAAAAGSGTTPTEALGGSETISIVGGVVTVSAPGFLAGDASDVGKTIKLISSSNLYQVVAFGDSQHCDVTPGDTIGPDTFAVYNTQQTGLTTELKRTITYLTGAPNCQTATSGIVTTMSRTFDFSAEVGGVTYNEVGFSDLNVTGSNLFSRVKLPSGVPLISGQQLRILYSLQISVSPTTPQSFGTSPVTGWSTATGNFQHVAIPVGYLATDGSTISSNVNAIDGFIYQAGGEPGQTPSVSDVLTLSTDASAFVSYGGQFSDNTPNYSNLQLGRSSYVAGTFTRDKFVTFPVGQANRTDWRSFQIGNFSAGNGQNSTSAQRFLMDIAQTKLSTHTLTLGFRMSWNRAL